MKANAALLLDRGDEEEEEAKPVLELRPLWGNVRVENSRLIKEEDEEKERS